MCHKGCTKFIMSLVRSQILSSGTTSMDPGLQNQFWSVTRENTAQRKTKGIELDCGFFFSFSPPLNLFVRGLQLISETLSFVFVRHPKDYRMKRDIWRGGRATVAMLCSHTRTHTRNISTGFLPPPPPPPPPTKVKAILRNIVTQMTFNWKWSGLKKSKKSNGATIRRVVQDRWGSQLAAQSGRWRVCVFLGW